MDELEHYGIPRRSGRYPWGSGDAAYQRNKSFLSDIDDLERQGMSPVEIAKARGMTTTELRKKRSIAANQVKAADIAMIVRLKNKGLSDTAIGKRMGKNESTIRSMLSPSVRSRAVVLENIANSLRDKVEEKGLIDISLGLETRYGVARTKFNTAVSILEGEGYNVFVLPVKQMGTGKITKTKALTPKGMTYSEAWKRRHDIKFIDDYSDDGGETIEKIKPIESIKRHRIEIRYADDTPSGKDKDGVIEIRRGLEDLSLGTARYAQVRIGVDGTHFMKGMALYSDDVPSGKDVIYNTNKKRGTPDAKVFKPMEINKETGEIDAENPFGSLFRQKKYIGADGEEHVSALNVVGFTPGSGEEGAWGKWSRSISSQIMSKQAPALAKRQLAEARDMKREEYDEIMSLTNPAVKKRLLETFADEADSAAVHLKAASLPRQAHYVILPVVSLSEREVYAPHFENGEPVVLIRHPHGGIFEIPELIVNNKNPEALHNLKDAKDGIGINPKVAAKLSGADFDGDTVIVIPNKNREIRTKPSLKGVVDFDPKESYPLPPGVEPMSEHMKGVKMGEISNLITDMTIKGGANDDDLARAVRHSMVVIDAAKHKLNYKQSYLDNNIDELKARYQTKEDGGKGGPATIISRAKSEIRIFERKPGKEVIDPVTGKKKRLYIDPETGEKLFTETGAVTRERKSKIDPITGKRVYYDTGKIIRKMEISTRMAEEKDAFNLSSGTQMENIYAEHANSMKALANKARKASIEVEFTPYSKSAREVYAQEVSALKSKLKLAYWNKPLERDAHRIANKVVSAKLRSNPDIEKDELKKLKFYELERARTRTGAKKHAIEITDREWEAIQAGAVTKNALTQILLNTDVKALKQRAMPHTAKEMSPARVNRARGMKKNGSTVAEIAKVLGVSTDTIEKVLA